MNKTTGFFNFLILNFKFILNNVTLLWSLLVFPLFFILLTVVMFPITNALGMIYLLGIIGPIGIIFSSITFNFRNSTLYNGQELTRNSNKDFYLSSLFFMLLFGYLLMVWMSLILIILSEFDLLIIGYAGFTSDASKEYYYSFNGIQWGGIFVAVTEIVLIMFSYSFLATCFIKSEKTYYIMVVIFILLSLIFGGNFNTYISGIPSSLGGIDVTNVKYKTQALETQGDDVFFYANTGAFPLFMLIPSLIFPFYGPGQLIDNVAWQTIWEVSSDGTEQLLRGNGEGNIWHIVTKESELWYPYWDQFAAENWQDGAETYSALYNTISSWQYYVYPVVLIIPIVHISVCIAIGIPYNAARKNIF